MRQLFSFPRYNNHADFNKLYEGLMVLSVDELTTVFDMTADLLEQKMSELVMV